MKERHGKRGRESLEGEPQRRDDKRTRLDQPHGDGFGDGGGRGGRGPGFQQRGGGGGGRFGGFRGRGRFGGGGGGGFPGEHMMPPLVAGPGPGMMGMPQHMLHKGPPMGGPGGMGGHLMQPPPPPGGAAGPGPAGAAPFLPPPLQHKFEDIMAKRRESHAALRRRQVAGLELSPGLLRRGPQYEQYTTLVLEAKAAAGPSGGGGGGGTAASGSSFAALGGVRRCYMAEALAPDEALVMPQQPAGYDPRAALAAAMQLYTAERTAGGQQLLSSAHGSFSVPAELAALLGPAMAEGRT